MKLSNLVMLIAAILILALTNTTACLAAESAPQAKQTADSCEEKGQEAAMKHVRELFGFWKTLYPEFINRALSQMTESDLNYHGTLTAAEDGFNGRFTARVQFRDTARPDYPSFNGYCYAAANKAVEELDTLRNERLAMKTRVDLTNKAIELGNKLSDTTPGAAKPKLTYTSGKAWLIVHHDSPIQLSEPAGKFEKGFKGYLTTELELDVTDYLDSDDKEQK